MLWIPCLLTLYFLVVLFAGSFLVFLSFLLSLLVLAVRGNFNLFLCKVIFNHPWFRFFFVTFVLLNHFCSAMRGKGEQFSALISLSFIFHFLFPNTSLFTVIIIISKKHVKALSLAFMNLMGLQFRWKWKH